MGFALFDKQNEAMSKLLDMLKLVSKQLEASERQCAYLKEDNKRLTRALKEVAPDKEAVPEKEAVSDNGESFLVDANPRKKVEW